MFNFSFMGLFDNHLFVCTLGGNMDREIVWVNPPPIGTGDHQRDMTTDIAFLDKSFAQRHSEIFKTRVEHCLIYPLGQFLNRDIHQWVADMLLDKLSFLIPGAKILVTAPAGRLIDLATWCSSSVHRIVFTGVDDARDHEKKKEQLTSATDVLLDWPLKDWEWNVLISRWSQSWPVWQWKVKNGNDWQPCDVEFCR